MKQRSPPQIRDFRCTECGNIATATKGRGNKTGQGHVKHMYCYVCQRITKHEQISRAK